MQYSVLFWGAGLIEFQGEGCRGSFAVKINVGVAGPNQKGELTEE